MDEPGFEFREGKIFLPPPKRLDWLWAPTILLFNERDCSFPRVKRPQREVDHAPPFSTDVKNAWNYTYRPPFCFHGVNWDRLAL